MKGFFESSQLSQSRVPLSMVPKCGQCGLYKTCNSPKMPVSGKGRRGILVVAEAPGEDEDDQGIQLVGNSGRELMKYFTRHGVNMREDCWLTNSLICRPPGNEIKNPKMVDWCRPNLINTIKDLEPSTIILLGGVAVDSLLGWLWRPTPGGITQWAGWRIPNQRLNAWVCPTFHPSYLLHEKNPVPEIFLSEHLGAAVGLKGRPWKRLPDYKSKVEPILDDKKAALIIKMMMFQQEGPIAFDYETNMLKPDGSKARIVSCSMSDGATTIAYPWRGRAIEATKEFLLSPVPKIASNLKFEHRWSRAILGVNPRNWFWDTMIASHVADNRRGITSIKFQAFVLLGQEPWDDHIKPYLESDESNGLNRIDEISIEDLLEYNGLDSLLEWEVARIQRKEMGHDS